MYKNLNDYQIKNYKKQTKKELLQIIDLMQGDINNTKKELLQSIDYMQNDINKYKRSDDIGGQYAIEVYKNKIPVQTISFGWDENPHGAKFSEVKDLSFNLMRAYQDYDSLIETKIIILDDWDELPAEQRKLIDINY